MTYKIANDVFFRKYGESTIVYQTDNHSVFVMNAICFDILHFFSDFNSIDDCVNALAKQYGFEKNGAVLREFRQFIVQLCEKNILCEKYTLTEKGDNLEEIIEHSNIIPKNSLRRVMFELTYRCNEKCRHCYCIAGKSEDELSTEKIKEIIDELFDMNVLELTFTGGDLFVREDTFEILEYAYSKNFLINIFTNGIALKDEDFYRLHRLHLKSISFSLYNYIPEKHDAFTGVKGSFNRTLIAAKKCIELGISVNIKTSVVEENLDDIDGILGLVESIGAHSETGISITPKNDGTKTPTELRIKAVERYLKALRTIASHVHRVRADNYDDLLVKDRKICWAGESMLSINPYGGVYACNALLLPCGDARTQSIREIWESSEMLKKIRSFSMNQVKNCGDCAMRQKCAFCPGTAFTETGDPLMKYQEACNITTAQVALRKEEMI